MAQDTADRVRQDAVDGMTLHVGAGAEAPLAGYLAATTGRIVLVEPDPEAAADLQDRVAALPDAARARVEVIAAAVAATDGPATLQVLNMADLSALTAPTGLREIYPGLRILSQVPVAGIAPAGLIARLEPMPEAGNRLIVEAAGQEMVLLAGLAEHGALTRFGRIDVVCGREPMYQGAVPAAEVLQFLQAQGYTPLSDPAAEDPDWCRSLLVRNPDPPERAELAAVQAQLAETTEALAAERRRTEALAAELAEARQALVDRAEQESLQAHSREEMIRAEGQIALIKELLLRGPEL